MSVLAAHIATGDAIALAGFLIAVSLLVTRK